MSSAFPYAFLKVLQGEEPYLYRSDDMLPKEQAEFLMQNSNMIGEYLGACLDSCRWGSQTTVMWEMSIRGMITFIQNWMHQNPDFQNLYHERPIEELYTKFELPHINHEYCPRDGNHKGKVRDLAGRVRCSHKSTEKFRPSFTTEYEAGIDKLSQTRTIDFFEDEPREPSSDEEGFYYDENEVKEYERDLALYNSEEPSLMVTDFCYAIISDQDLILPLETILKRENLKPKNVTVYCHGKGLTPFSMRGPCERLDELDKRNKKFYERMGDCPGHAQENDKIEFHFDGWILAHFVQKWYEQDPGNAPWYE